MSTMPRITLTDDSITIETQTHHQRMLVLAAMAAAAGIYTFGRIAGKRYEQDGPHNMVERVAEWIMEKPVYKDNTNADPAAAWMLAREIVFSTGLLFWANDLCATDESVAKDGADWLVNMAHDARVLLNAHRKA